MTLRFHSVNRLIGLAGERPLDGLGVKVREVGPVSAIDPDLMIRAYRAGYFPMAESASDPRVTWYRPRLRGVIDLGCYRVPRRLRRAARKMSVRVGVDEAFNDLVRACAQGGRGRELTWINATLATTYSTLHRRGIAHSVEVYQGQKLVGGFFGLAIGALFCGESMVSRVKNASKVALAAAMPVLADAGFALIDIQFPNVHLEQFGAQVVDGEAYVEVIRALVDRRCQFPKLISEGL